MDPSSVIQIIVLFFLVFLSAFFSSAETAFSTANQIRIKTLVAEGNKRAAVVQSILDRYPKMLSTILIGNNIVNISASALATILAASTGLNWAVSVATGLLTVVVLIFGEILPKTWAILNSDKISMAYAPIIRFLMIILTPLIFLVDKVSFVILRLLRIDPNKKNALMTENELRTYLDAGHEDGVLEEEEKEMIYNVFDFGDALAKDIMIPRIDMATVEVTANYDEVMDVFRENMYTRIPVFENRSDNIVGIINMKDILLIDHTKPFDIHDIMREPYYTYEYKKTSDLMLEMRKSTTNIALVLNEYGATEGMITMEDLLEEIVGEIRDEYDQDEEELIQQIDEYSYLVPGGMKLDDINNSIDTSFCSKDYDSIGGLIIEHLDKLPEQGESVTLEDGITLTVDAVQQNRIEKVLMTLPSKDDTEEPSEE